MRCQRESGGANIDCFLRKVEQNRGKITVVGTEFEPKKRLVGHGGVAAILQFRID